MVAVAGVWRQRAGVSDEIVAVGSANGKSLPAVLLGVRLGCCEIQLSGKLFDRQVDARVSHDVLLGAGLRLVARIPEPFGNEYPWPVDPSQQMQGLSMTDSNLGRVVSLEDMTLASQGHDEDFDGYASGTVGRLVLGDPEATSTRWSGYLLGLDIKLVDWRGSVGSVAVSLEPLRAAPRWAGVAALLRRKPSSGRLIATMQWLTWRRSSIPPDLPAPTLVKLVFPAPTTAKQAEDLLLQELMWPLDLFAGRRLVLAGVWDDSGTAGRLTDLGRPLTVRGGPAVETHVLARDYLDSVLPTWQTMNEDEKLAVKIGIGVRDALPPDLEPAVVVGAMGLEHLAEALLPPTSNSYDLSKKQKEDIRSRLDELAADVAPGTRWSADLPRLKSSLFNPPASDRISTLCSMFRVDIQPGEIKAYADARNPITHGRPTRVSLQQKLTAMLFERQVLGEVLLRKIGFSGPVADARQWRLIPRGTRED